jgi:hypothetical protein
MADITIIKSKRDTRGNIRADIMRIPLPLNLDDMSVSELSEFWGLVHFHPRQTALKLFPKRPRGYVNQTKLLGHYACNKHVARMERELGSIENARKYENICDDIYKQLADYAKTW